MSNPNGRKPDRILQLGDKISHLTVDSGYEMVKRKSHVWCVCDCGVRKLIGASRLCRAAKLSLEISCGCVRSAKTVARNTVHGQAIRGKLTAEHRAWSLMRSRCSNAKLPEFQHYGGRGISVCERWGTFQAFFDDMGPKPSPKHSLERKDVDKGYCPDNCTWATVAEQSRNKRNSRKITFNGVTKNIKDWASELGIADPLLRYRLERMSVEEAFTAPVRKQRSMSLVESA